MSLAILSRARGVRAALAWVAWDMKASFVAERFLRQLHSTPGRPSPTYRSDRVVAGSRPTCLGIASRDVLVGVRGPRTTRTCLDTQPGSGDEHAGVEDPRRVDLCLDRAQHPHADLADLLREPGLVV